LATPAQVSRWPPALLALVLQLAAFALVLLFARTFPGQLTWAGAAILCGALAAVGAALLRMDRWWILLQALFVPALFMTMTLGWPPWVFLSMFAAVALLFWSTVRSRVPLYLSGLRTWEAVATCLPGPTAERILRCADLGSGFGGLLLHLARRRGDMQFEGFELAPLPVAVSSLRVRFSGQTNLRIRWCSFWSQDLSRFDLVFAFLSPVPMSDLWRKARREMRPGAMLVSCAFAVPDVEPERVIELGGARQTRLYVYRLRPAA
jgi:SAM-dependent methyltransferase